jgi:hypothetical protein
LKANDFRLYNALQEKNSKLLLSIITVFFGVDVKSVPACNRMLQIRDALQEAFDLQASGHITISKKSISFSGQSAPKLVTWGAQSGPGDASMPYFAHGRITRPIVETLEKEGLVNWEITKQILGRNLFVKSVTLRDNSEYVAN